MLQRLGRWFLIAGLFFGGIEEAQCEQGPAAAAVSRSDQYGDPLPDGALQRLGTVRLRHAAKVYQLAYLNGSKVLASLGEDHLFHHWDAATGKELARFSRQASKIQIGRAFYNDMVFIGGGGFRQHYWGTPAPSYNAAFSANGRVFAAVTQDAVIELYDLNAGRELGRLELKQGSGQGVALSPDGSLVACSGVRDSVFVWETATGKEVRQLQWPRQPVQALYFSPDSVHLAGVSAADVRVWSLATGKRHRKFEGHENNVTGVAFTRDGKRLATVGSDRTFRLWELDSEEELDKAQISENQLTALALSPDGTQAAIASWDNQVHFFDLTAKKVVRLLSGFQSPVFALAFSPDGKTLASGGDDGKIRLWEAATGKELLPPKHLGRIHTAFFLKDGRSLATGNDDGTIRHWDASQGKELRRSAGPEPASAVVAFSLDGSTVAVAEDQGVIRLWDSAHGKEIRRLEGHSAYVQALAFSPDGRLLASAAQDLTMRIWKLASGKEQTQVVLLKNVDPNEFRGYSGNFNRLVFSPDSRTLAAVSNDNKVRLWEAASGKERLAFRSNQAGVGPLVFSPDGRWMVTGGNDETVRLWDAMRGNLIQGFLGHRGNITAVAVSADGRLVASGGDDRTVRIWDAAGSKELHYFEGHQGTIVSLAFAGDGKTLVSASADTTGLIWDLTAPGPSKIADPLEPLDRKMSKLWLDLASDDAGMAYQALGEIVHLGVEVLPWLAAHLSPVPPLDQRQVTRLAAELDHVRYHVRDKAEEDLQKIGPPAVPALQRMLAQKPSPEARKRLERLLEKLDKPETSPQTLRLFRAVEVVERLGGPDARRILETLARGAPDARQTQEAVASLERLSKK